MLPPWKKSSMTNLDSILKSRDSTLPAKVHLVKAMVFPVVLNGRLRVGLKRKLSTKELMLLNYDVGEDSRSPANLQGNQPWIFIGRTDVEAETPMFWLPDVKNWLIWKDPDEGKGLMLKEKRTTEHPLMLSGINDSMGMSLIKFQELVMNREA